ncbi:MAG: TonB-dependent receptor, partial [Parasphingopyxis sp.]|uniref:TonB-dependent receptor n=1 Tax=Parasphingopyxis sp. TaxID=1920299 RepID=UPI0032EA9CC3
MRINTFTLVSSAALAWAMAPSLATAQSGADGAAAQSASNDVIVVTAQRREEALQDVPIAVTAFQGEQLQQAGIDDVLELSRVTPSLLITEGSSQAQPFIRGVGGRNITPGNEATTAVYIDGVYQTEKTGIMLQSFPDVESVQVLRGPQGTLFGRNATSGAILITTRMPEDEFGAMVEGTYGTQDRQARGFLTAPLGDSVAFSVSGFYRYETPYLINLNPSNGLGSHTGDEESYGVRANLLIEPASNFSVLLQGNFGEGYTRAVMAVQPIEGGPTTLGEAVSVPFGINIRQPRRAYHGEITPEVDFNTWGVSARTDLDLSTFSIRSTTAYSESGSGVQLDLDASPVPVFWFDTNLQSRTFQQELLVSSNTSSPFQWLLGGFYINYRDGYEQLDQYVGLSVPQPLRPHTVPQQLLDFSALGLGPTSGLAYIDQTSFVTVESLGLFGEASYEFGNGTKITAGLRYTDETHTLDSDNRRATYVPDGLGGVITIPSTTTAACAANPTCSGLSTGFSELTYRLVLDHEFSSDVLAYASYNRGFKSGVYNISSIPNVIATEPETIDAFEVGLKTQLFDRQLTLNTALYYYNYDNLQVPVVDPQTNTQRSINAAKATISGLEIELAWNPSSRLSLNAGFSTFFQSEYDSFPNCEIYRP